MRQNVDQKASIDTFHTVEHLLTAAFALRPNNVPEYFKYKKYCDKNIFATFCNALESFKTFFQI